ncbi:MAG: glycine zipper domain-containing protein [Ginsengibacter sp.]
MIIKTFKNLLMVLLVSGSFIACNNSNGKSDSRNIQLLSDSSAYHNSTLTDSASMKNNAGAIHTGNKTFTRNGNSQASEASVNSGGTTGNSTSSSNGSSATTSSKKKGWSKGAQGAVIGGAAGAVGGAIISKKKGTGAVIGGVVGAAGGYIIGHEKDKKDGRIKK